MTTTCNPSAPFVHKRGASFHALIRIPSAFGDGYFAGWSLASQARTDKDVLLSDLVVAWDDPVTTRVLVLKCLDTTGWVIGPAQLDVKLTGPDGFVMPTSTADFYVVKDITHD